MRRHKYNAKKTKIDGITFDSKLEARRYQELKLLEKANEITELVLQPRFRLLEGYNNGTGVRIRPMDYVADFQYIDKRTGRKVVEDCKGMKTEVYKTKKKIFEKEYYPLTITEITR